MADRTLDAQPAPPGPNWREQSWPPRHAAVWFRLHGEWRRGTITAWVKIADEPRAPWTCQIRAEPDTGPGSGRYVYDPQTIRPAKEDLLHQMQPFAARRFL